MTEEEIAKIQADQERQFIQKQQEMLSGGNQNSTIPIGSGFLGGPRPDAGEPGATVCDEDGAMQATARKQILKIIQTIKNKDQRVDPWVFHEFDNPARDDRKLLLHHWSKVKEKDEEYAFIKFNKKLETFHNYTDQEYRDAIQPLPVPTTEEGEPKRVRWSRPDTDLLFRLCDQFQLRFVVIADRFNFEKVNEAKKAEERWAAKFGNVHPSNPRARERKCKDKEQKKQTADSQKKETKTIQPMERSVEEIKDRYY